MSVMNAVMRIPSASVNVNWAPGWGRSARRITREPAGQAARLSTPVMSATQAPSRIPPSVSIAAAQQCSGT
jgi:hypothetical protein